VCMDADDDTGSKSTATRYPGTNAANARLHGSEHDEQPIQNGHDGQQYDGHPARFTTEGHGQSAKRVSSIHLVFF